MATIRRPALTDDRPTFSLRLLAGLAATAAGAVIEMTLTGCLAASDPVAGSHPALAPPLAQAEVAQLRLPGTRDARKPSDLRRHPAP